ncbi:hypothetical protein EVAR_38273_1 [Eumeta japonica]|uniref:Uncharacterized protein n=1 Tax=Eumeta variegata TaxID=151549 RepID=A0A4C1W9H4_EUMVA|nr:hypothetical protein EVAR_38273_1 [Eumeta japonica]
MDNSNFKEVNPVRCRSLGKNRISDGGGNGLIKGGVGYRNSHLLNEMQQRKQQLPLLHFDMKTTNLDFRSELAQLELGAVDDRCHQCDDSA